MFFAGNTCVQYQLETSSTSSPSWTATGAWGASWPSSSSCTGASSRKPALYQSFHLKQFRGEYYALLCGVREKGDFERWTRFFLGALTGSAEDALRTLDQLKDLHERNRQKLPGMPGSSKAVLAVFKHLQTMPVIDIGSTAQNLGLSFNAAAAAVQRLQDADILVQPGKDRRNRSLPTMPFSPSCEAASCQVLAER